MKIVSTHPLVIETYSDTYYLDAELNVCHLVPDLRSKVRAPGTTWLLGSAAESHEELAFSTAKADQLKVGVDELHRRSERGDLGAPPQ